MKKLTSFILSLTLMCSSIVTINANAKTSNDVLTDKIEQPSTADEAKPSSPDTAKPTKPSTPDTIKPTEPSTPDTAKPFCLFGDVDDDGEIKILDATVIQKHIAQLQLLSDSLLPRADFNGDLQIDITDATDIQKRIAGLDYKYTHEAYPVTFSKLPPKGEKLDYKLDKASRHNEYGDKVIFSYGTDKYEKQYTTVFTSYEQYKAFFKDTFDEYNKSFFEDNALVYVYRFYYNSSTKFSVDNVLSDGSTLYLDCCRKEPAPGLPVEEALGNTNIFIKVNKADVENINAITVCEKFETYTY